MKTKNRFSTVWILILFAVIALAACQTAGPQAPTVPPDAAFTQAAQTIIAGLTQNAPTATLTPPPPLATDTAVPTSPPASTDTPAPTETQPPTATQPAATQPAATPAGEIILEEDFSDERGWAEQSNDDFGFGFKDGGYQIYVNILNAAIWSIRDQAVEDVILEVDASQTGGPEDGYYGLVCRHQDEDNYYALVIGSSGFAGIAKMEDGELEWLQEETAPEGVIHPDDAVNHIRADCIGETLTLYANGQQVASIEDDDFDSGSVGMVAGTRRETGVEVLFDNFVILEPR